MTTIDLASHLFHLLLDRNPTEKEATDLSTLGLGHEGYLWHDERAVHGFDGRPVLLLYTSCHAEQILSYLKQYRPEIVQDNYVFVLFTHRLLLHRGYFALDLVHALFNRADLIITNPMNPKFEELSTIPLLTKIKSGCKVATFVPPSFAAFWPVVEVFGEEPVAKAMLEGLNADQIIARFNEGSLDCMFDYRYQTQIARIKRREQDCDVAISGFIERHLRTHKMFFTYNHPSFHLVSWMTECLLSKLGYSSQGEDWALSTPVNGASFTNHHPETEYEWLHYGFKYPRRFIDDFGGATVFYPDAIRKAVNKITDPAAVLANPVTPVEIEP